MAATYSPSLSNEVSQVRQWLGDTGNGAGAFPQAAEVQDETIQAYLDQGCSVLRAAARLARDLSARYAKMVDVDVDDQLTKASQRYKQYKELAASLDALADAEAAGGDTNSAPVYVAPLVYGVGDMRGPLDPRDASGNPVEWP